MAWRRLAHWRGAVSIMRPTPVPINAPETGWPVATPTPVPMSPPAMVAHPPRTTARTTNTSNLIVRAIVRLSYLRGVSRIVARYQRDDMRVGARCHPKPPDSCQLPRTRIRTRAPTGNAYFSMVSRVGRSGHSPGATRRSWWSTFCARRRFALVKTGRCWV